jgi:hypothetical protein
MTCIYEKEIMTTRFKDFGASDSNKEPLAFKLHGEDFNCYPDVQGKFFLQLIAESNSDDPTVASESVTKFFNRILYPESAIRFNALLEDPERIVKVETLTEIAGWLMEEYSDRPETQPEA